MSATAVAAANRLLQRLPASERRRIDAHGEPTDLPAGRIVCASGSRIRHAVFPLTAMISLRASTRERDSLQVALFGRDGMIGLSLRDSGDVAPLTAVVEVAGAALLVEAHIFRQVLASCETLRGRVDRHANACVASMARGVACNRFHSVESRMARLLLMIDDRGASGPFALTQTMLAQMLGVRRPTISHVARSLAGAGLVHYSRGRVAVVDRDGLHGVACSCYDSPSDGAG